MRPSSTVSLPKLSDATANSGNSPPSFRVRRRAEIPAVIWENGASRTLLVQKELMVGA